MESIMSIVYPVVTFLFGMWLNGFLNRVKPVSEDLESDGSKCLQNFLKNLS